MIYTSPTSGTVYEVKESTEYRADYREFMNPATRYMREYTQYTIYRDGKWFSSVSMRLTLPPLWHTLRTLALTSAHGVTEV